MAAEWEDDETGTKATIAEQAENGHVDDDDAEELFPLGSLNGDELTVAKVVKGRVEVKAALTRAQVPVTGGGLFDPNRAGRALVTFMPGKFTPSPERRDDGSVESWVVTQELRVTHVRHANDEVEVIRDEFAALCSDDARSAEAGALLDELREVFSAAARG